MAEYGQVYCGTIQVHLLFLFLLVILLLICKTGYECGDGAALPLRFIREGVLHVHLLRPFPPLLFSPKL